MAESIPSHEHDIIVVGGGAAGLRAAIAVAQADPTLDVAIVSKVYPMRSHTVSAEGGAAGVIKANDSLDAHCLDTISGSDWLADQPAVEAFVQEAPQELLQLEHWGCPWSREPDGSIAVRPFGGMKIERTWYAADKTGFHLLHTLFQTSLKFPSIRRYDEWFVTKLLVADGRCCGITALELRTGVMHLLGAKAVIVCTGGAGRIFPFTTNGAIKTGDGMGLAYRAGVPLKDMEFVQYHPTGLPGTGILITEAARGEGGILVNKDGYRYLQDYGLGPAEPWPRLRAMELGPRDKLSQAFIYERQKHRTLDGPHGDYVLLDVRHLGEEKIDQKIPFVRELARRYVGIDPVHEAIPVRPVVHYMMGGIHTDLDGATPLPGLYAAGEVACVSINGANRLGSNSLSECLVFGLVTDEARRINERYLHKEGGRERIAALRTEMQTAMERGAGIFRDETTLRQTCATLADLRGRMAQLRLEDHSRSFNTELTAAIELEFMVEIAEAIAHSALARTESRGSHQRSDYPRRDDARFLKHTLIYRTDGTPRTDFLTVGITRWPPGERVYGG
ncbi:MAG: fumarate reductase (quinol) flavoprotein subunit [Armatimonadetes bacterium 13_1_40CM_64_14]|nr:MAG: fumarate reductase (quinol) flavoprotein subunit [Armatimonadetes bacterium 13_1_40CM_64_14]